MCLCDQEEALEYDKHPIDIYEKKDGDCSELLCHVQVEISSSLYHFVWAIDGIYAKDWILGKQKREVGVAPASLMPLQ